MITSDDVREAYDGVDGRLYELMLGELLHVGGLKSSLELAERAGISEGSRGVDLCCGNGASMRLLVQLKNVASMIGVDVSEKQVERTTMRTEQAGFADRIRVVHGDASQTDLPDAEADFVWSEDAWCYVPDKAKLIAEAIRLTRPGGTIAFTDWTFGEQPFTDDERDALYAGLKFPGLWSGDDYRNALLEGGCEIVEVSNTHLLTRGFALYCDMFDFQLGWDVLQIIPGDPSLVEVVTDQLGFVRDLGQAEKIQQTRVIARRAP